ncbi:unnamed protein product [Tenebrio molitor]|jgi:phosphatidylinositol glycan class F|nr:unnamed protein product [Tenebrio molitor]
MQGKRVSVEYSQVLHSMDVVTSLYLPLYVGYLFHNNLLLKIGRFDNIHNILILAAIEIIKYIFYTLRNKSLIQKNHVKDFFKVIGMFLLSLISIYIMAVLFGAPALSNFEETFMFSFIVTTVTALPVCLHLGLKDTLNIFLSLTSYEGTETQKLFMLKVRLTLLGAWLGAIVIPLDWNRPWQNWPIPTSVGTILGYMVANWICSLLQYKNRGRLIKKTGKYAL